MISPSLKLFCAMIAAKCAKADGPKMRLHGLWITVAYRCKTPFPTMPICSIRLRRLWQVAVMKATTRTSVRTNLAIFVTQSG